MNGFSAADMSTAAANGFRDGLAAQPASAQEAVAYNSGGIELTACQLHEALLMAGSPELDVEFDDRSRVRIFHADNGHSGPGFYCECVDVEEEGCILLDGTSPAIAAPVAAAPVMESMGKRKLMQLQGDGFIVNGVAIYNPETGRRGLVDYIGYVGWVGNTPAAPGIDLGQFREAVENLEWQNRGHANPDFPTGDPEKHAECLRLLALIDASPKGVSTDENIDLLPELRDVEDYFTSVDPNPIHLATVRQAISAIVGSPKGGADAAWREGWALAYSGPSNLYGDDGELQDNSSIPCIDWWRDSAEVIRDKITERGNRLIAATQPTSHGAGVSESEQSVSYSDTETL